VFCYAINISHDSFHEEGNEAAERSFTLANAVEKIHAELYQKALDNLDGVRDTDYYVCSACGNTVENEAPDTCPICGAKSLAFSKVN
jgi:rubrerythrin